MHYLNRLEGIKRAKRVIRDNPNWKNSFKILIKTRAPCSCAMCSRGRKTLGETQQEKKMNLELERERHHPKKKKKSIIVKYRLRPDIDPDKFWYFLHSKEWKKWHAYLTIKGAKEAIAIQSRKFDWLEYRLKPEGDKNENV